MKESQKSQHEALSFLYKLALDINQGTKKADDLQTIFEQYIIDQKDHFPFITLSARDYYSEVNTKLLKLENEPILQSVLVGLFSTHPPIEGGISGDHTSYDQVKNHENMVSIIGRFADCYDLID